MIGVYPLACVSPIKFETPSHKQIRMDNFLETNLLIVRDLNWLVPCRDEFLPYHLGTILDKEEEPFQTCLSSLASIGSYFKPECV